LIMRMSRSEPLLSGGIRQSLALIIHWVRRLAFRASLGDPSLRF
jgi:hypothetical protein